MKSLCFTILLFLGFSLVACNKDKDSAIPSNNGSPASFIGKWTGKYGFSNDVPDHFFSLNIKTDGEIQELNSSGVAKGKGTWVMQGNTLKGNYKMLFIPFSEYSVIVTVNPSGQMEGTWGYDKDGTDGGKLLLAKQ